MATIGQVIERVYDSKIQYALGDWGMTINGTKNYSKSHKSFIISKYFYGFFKKISD